MESEDFGCSKVTNWKIERLKNLKFVALWEGIPALQFAPYVLESASEKKKKRKAKFPGFSLFTILKIYFFPTKIKSS
jgi:hypothetical protein